MKILVRATFIYLALVSGEIGIWALLAPRWFYDRFPGLGRAWVSIDGPYNEHLVRDVGALNLALVVVFVAALVTLRRDLVITAALAAFVWGGPHLVYHAINTDGYSAGDLALSLAGLALFAAFPLAVLMGRHRLVASVDQAALPHE